MCGSSFADCKESSVRNSLWKTCIIQEKFVSLQKDDIRSAPNSQNQALEERLSSMHEQMAGQMSHKVELPDGLDEICMPTPSFN